MDAVKAIRNTRTEMNVPPSKKASVYIETDLVDIFEPSKQFFERLTSASDVSVATKQEFVGIETSIQIATADTKIFIPLDDLVDKEKEKARLDKEKQACEKEIKILSGKLSNESFVSKAPEKVVNDIKEKLSNWQEKLSKVEDAISSL